MARKHERTTARQSAAQVLYAGEIRAVSPTDLLNNEGVLCLDAPFSDYAMKLVEGVEEHKPELDKALGEISENWSVERMPIMDRTIMRIALFEMLHVEDVPVSVSINEAVELAKDFGGDDDSPRFVNGMLGRLARQMEGVEESELNDLLVKEAKDAGTE